MFYSIAATEQKFELLVLIVLLLNIAVFVCITFIPTLIPNIRSWATRMVEWAFRGLSS